MARFATEKQIHHLPAIAFLSGGQGGDMAAKMTYLEQLKHPLWQQKRLRMLEAGCWRCSLCSEAGTTLHVHHKRYVKGRMVWEYEDEELNVLCELCHGEEHELQELLSDLLVAAQDWNPQRLAAALLGGYFAEAVGGIDESLAARAKEAEPAYFTCGVILRALTRNGGFKIIDFVRQLHTADRPMSSLLVRELADLESRLQKCGRNRGDFQ